MKCVLPTCTRDAEYIFSGMSMCGDHYRNFKRNMLGDEALAPILNEIPKGEPGPDLPIKPILLKGSGKLLAEYTQWKGRKKPSGGYYPADDNWGWEFADQFPPDIVSLVMSAPQIVAGYEYTSNETGTTIMKRKA